MVTSMRCVGRRFEACADSGASRVTLVQQGSLSGPGHHQRLALPAQAHGQSHLIILTHCLLLLLCLTPPCDLSDRALILSPVYEAVVTRNPYSKCHWQDEQVEGPMGQLCNTQRTVTA